MSSGSGHAQPCCSSFRTPCTPPALLRLRFSVPSTSLHTAPLLCTQPRFSAQRRTQRASLHHRASLHTAAHSALLLLQYYGHMDPYCSLHAYRAGCSAVDEQRAVLISARSYPRTRSRVRPTGGGRPRHSHSGTLNGRTVTLNGSTQLPRNLKR
jgi:hypothetical protein